MKKLHWFVLAVFCFALIVPGFSQGKPSPADSEDYRWDMEPGESKTIKNEETLITPLDPQPINIDDALGRRLKIMGRTAKSAIIYIVDGLNAGNIRLARDILVGRQNQLEMDKFPVVGRVIGYPIDAPVHDSAAAATELATGKPAFMKRIALDQQNKPMTSLFEVARGKGFKVGLVSDTRMTHATPAAFSGHVQNRDDEEILAQQMVQSQFNVLMSGGRKFFLPKSQGGEQTSNQDLLEMAKLRGFRVIGSKKELAESILAKPERLLGLFSPSYMPQPMEKEYPETPTLAEMTLAALNLLGHDGTRFLLMVEAGRVDFANHAQDVAHVVSQMKVMEDTLKMLTDYVRCHADTLLIVVSDHGTTGMMILDEFDPEKFRALATSTILLARKANYRADQVATVLKSAFPGFEFAASDIAALDAIKDPFDFETALGHLVAEKFGISFMKPALQRQMARTHGHTGEDLFLHAMGSHQGLFGGVLRMWEIPGRLGAILGIPFP